MDTKQKTRVYAVTFSDEPWPVDRCEGMIGVFTTLELARAAAKRHVEKLDGEGENGAYVHILNLDEEVYSVEE